MRRHRDEELPYIIIEREAEGGGVMPFLWGALIGAGVALLFAPRSGRETRAEITGGVRKLQDSVTQAVDGVREQVTNRVSAARGAFDTGRSAARESRADMERRIREARASFESGQRTARRGREYTDDDLDEDEEI